MNVALISCSPKTGLSASGVLMELLPPMLDGRADVSETSLARAGVDDTVNAVRAADAAVFFAPLYVDGLPSHVVEFLQALEKAKLPENASMHIVVNCGFWEGEHARSAIRIFENWCARCGCTFGGAVGVGGGGAIAGMPPQATAGMMKSIEGALSEMADSIIDGAAGPVRYVTIAAPRAMYIWAGHMGWRRSIKANGGRPKDLNQRV